ncbi:hypothetical protein HAX54_004610, partial [Datura stramonium]|nr:hypothetical protein [Datura stramonium]
MAKIDAYYDYANDVEQVDILNGDQVDRVKDGCDGSENESKEEEDVDICPCHIVQMILRWKSLVHYDGPLSTLESRRSIRCRFLMDEKSIFAKRLLAIGNKKVTEEWLWSLFKESK